MSQNLVSVPTVKKNFEIKEKDMHTHTLCNLIVKGTRDRRRVPSFQKPAPT